MNFESDAMPKCRCLRWAFDISKWKVTQSVWLSAIQSIQLEELSRAKRFLFQSDAKFAVAGRLLIRQSICRMLGLPWCAIQLRRSEKGKPILDECCLSNCKVKYPEHFSFNISHHGDFLVLSCSCASQCGVDVMRFESPRRGYESVDDYLKLMRPQFSDREYTTMLAMPSDEQKLTLFYRYWCLKESYIKAIGVGLYQELSELDFDIQDQILWSDSIVQNSELIFNGVKLPDYLFEEHRLDDAHLIAVCVKNDRPAFCNGMPTKFTFLKFGDLMKDAQPLHCPLTDEYHEFCEKLTK